LIVNKLGFKKKDVASISCWEVMDNAFESVPGTTFTNHGTRPMYDPETNIADPIMFELNQQQLANFPGDDTRGDKDTVAQAMHYLEKYQPRFLWISLGDTDEYAHANNLEGYNKTLTFYDNTIDQLINLLKKLHLDEETMVIVTTDHGRGNGVNWVEHGDDLPESKQTWAFVFNGELAAASAVKEGDILHYNTLAIRPTVEKAFGL
jgi:predicted AlkP superfamily pyrophosphatase or phosphodiesterase